MGRVHIVLRFENIPVHMELSIKLINNMRMSNLLILYIHRLSLYLHMLDQQRTSLHGLGASSVKCKNCRIHIG